MQETRYYLLVKVKVVLNWFCFSIQILHWTKQVVKEADLCNVLK